MAAWDRQFSEAELDELAKTCRRDGVVVLKQILDPAKLRLLRTALAPALAARMSRAGPDRGPSRYYATPPFVPPFFDPEVFQHPAIMGVVKRLIGEDCVMCQYASDTPVDSKSDYQEIHRDAAPLFPECEDGKVAEEPPMAQIAVNFPLVDVLPPSSNRPSNGPVEIIKGTHRLSVAEGQALIKSGVKLEPSWMALGDVSIRDVRMLHRGSPNRTDEPREMMVLGYSRAWLRRPEVGLRVKRSLYDGLNAEGRALLRFERIVPDEDFGEYPGEGWSPNYDAAALQSASGGSIKAKL